MAEILKSAHFGLNKNQYIIPLKEKTYTRNSVLTILYTQAICFSHKPRILESVLIIMDQILNFDSNQNFRITTIYDENPSTGRKTLGYIPVPNFKSTK